MKTDKKYIAIIDYGMGNLFSIMNICRYVGIEAVKTSERKTIENASAIILPGIGAFGDAMSALRKIGLIAILRDFINSGKPFLGICLGMQLLMSESEEFGINKGLNLIEGKVVRFPKFNAKREKIRVPHIGWNKIFFRKNRSAIRILDNIRDGEYMYFVHSYFAVPKEEIVIAYADYCGVRYCSGIQKDNIFAFQFHPEKSGSSGIQLFENFKGIINKS